MKEFWKFAAETLLVAMFVTLLLAVALIPRGQHLWLDITVTCTSVLLYSLIALATGMLHGEKDMRFTRLLMTVEKDTGKKPSHEELSRVYNPMRGLLAPLAGHSLIILPALVCAAAALFDGGALFDVLSPYLSLTTGSFMGIYVLILNTTALAYKPFIVLGASLVFPLMVFLGYLYGKKLDQRTMQAIARSKRKAMRAGEAKVIRKD